MVSEQVYYTGQSIMMDTRSKAVDEHLKKLDLEITHMGKSFKVVTNRLENNLTSIDQTLQVIGHRQEKIEATLLDMNHKFENFVAMLTHVSSYIKMGQKNKGVEETVIKERSEGVISILGASNTESSTHAGGDLKENNRMPTIGFPHFGGEEPREWLNKARKYFQLHQIPHELRLGIAEMCLKGKAGIWFDGFLASHPNAYWRIFSEELCKRFDENTEIIEEEGESKEERESEPNEKEVMEISNNALAGNPGHKTIRIPGILKGRKISILIDNGSTHSFIDERLAKDIYFNRQWKHT